MIRRYSDQWSLKHFDFDEFAATSRKNFIGRQWLYRELEDLLEHSGKRGVMLVGNPGSGKTAFASNLLCSRAASSLVHDRIAGYHFCMHSDKGTQNAAKFVQNLANMVASTFEDYNAIISRDSFVRRALKEECSQAPEWCFQEGILTPLKSLPKKPREIWYIVIDALDECSTDGKDEILTMLKSKVWRFPKWLKLIITSRNVSSITKTLAGIQVLELRSDDWRNLEDIDTYSSFKVYPLQASILHGIKNFFAIKENSTPDEKIVGSLVKKSQGNFLYLAVVLDFLLEAPESFSWSRQEFPKTLDSIFQLSFERKFSSPESFRSLREIFEVLVAAYSPLSAEDIYSLLSLDNPTLDFEYDIMSKLEEVSLYLWKSEKGLLRIFHASFSDWLTSKSNMGKFYYIKKKKGHRRLAEYYLQNLKRTRRTSKPEEAFFLACHIVEGGSNRSLIDDFQSIPSHLVNGSDEVKTTSLHLSSRLPKSDVTELLLPHFHDIDCLDDNYRTPAFVAAAHGRLENLNIFLDRGANINHVVSCPNFEASRYAKTAVHMCQRRTCEYSLLYIAAQEGNFGVVEFLLEHHVSPMATTGCNNTAVQLAASNGYIEAVIALDKAGAVLDGICLHHAAAEGHSHIVEYLLNEGVRDECIGVRSIVEFYSAGNKEQDIKVHAYDNNHLKMRETALHAAARKDHPTVIESLLRHGEKSAINCLNFAGRRPLHEAVYHNKYNALKAMLAAGANASLRCDSSKESLGPLQNPCTCEYTPLHIAAKHGSHSVAELLIAHHADLNAGDCNGSSPLHIASCHGMISLIKLLVNRGARINGRSLNGSTPLHSAATCLTSKSFRPLFDLGSDFLAKDDNNMTALFYIIKDVRAIGMEYFLDLYVNNPKDWIELLPGEKEPHVESDLQSSWLSQMIELSKSYAEHVAATWQLVDDVIFTKTYDEVLFSVGQKVNSSLILTGINAMERSRLVTIATPRAFLYDTIFHDIWKGFVPTFKKTNGATLVPEPILKALSRTAAILLPGTFNCSVLTLVVKANLIRLVNILLRAGFDVDCQDDLGDTPLSAYLHTGGRHMSKVMVKNRATITISCDEPFGESILHMMSYHKLHYLHYLPKFIFGGETLSEYLLSDNFLFDYFLNEYELIQNDGNSETISTGDGPLILAVTSHPRGPKILNECFDSEGYNALHRAAQGANLIAIQRFLSLGADPSIENSYGFSPLWLAVLNSVKYTPSLNLHQRNVITALEVEFASISASVILEHLLRSDTIDMGCSESRNNLTLYHVAAIRGMWQLVAHLLSDKRITGIDVNCANKDGITPMYLAMLVGGRSCDWHSPWCKVIQTIKDYGGTLQIPVVEAEYFLLFDLFFGMSPGQLLLELTDSEILTLQENCGHEECKEYKSREDLLSKSFFEINMLYSDYNEQVDHCSMCPKECPPVLRRDLLHFQTMSSIFIRRLRPLISEHGVISKHFSTFLETARKRVELLILKLTKPSVRVSHECTENCRKETLALGENKTYQEAVNLETAMHNLYNKFKASLDELEERLSQVKSDIFSTERPPHVLLEIRSALHKYGITLSCDWQSLAARYVILRFQVQNLKLGVKQVLTNSRLLGISDFASLRMKTVFIESPQETLKLILRLTLKESSEYSDDFRYLMILRFRKPPLWKGTFDTWRT